MEQQFAFFNRLALKKQVIFGVLAIFFVMGFIAISIVFVNLILISYLSYYYLTNVLEGLENDEIKALMRLVEFDSLGTIENSRFGIQWARNYHERLLTNPSFFENFLNLNTTYSNYFVDTTKFDPKNVPKCQLNKPSSTSKITTNNNAQTVSTAKVDINDISSITNIFQGSNYQRTLYSTNVNNGGNSNICYGFTQLSTQPQSQATLDLEKKVFALLYPLISNTMKTNNRYSKKEKFKWFFFSFPEYAFYYPYNGRINPYFNITNNMYTAASTLKYISVNFLTHLLEKSLNYVDPSKIPEYLINNPIVSYTNSLKVQRPYLFDIESTAYIAMINTKLNFNPNGPNSQKLQLKLSDIYTNPLKYFNSMFFGEVDNLGFDTLMNLLLNKYKGYSSQAFDETQYAILLYNNCLKNIRAFENFQGNTSYTDKLIEYAQQSSTFNFKKFPIFLKDCYINPITLTDIMDVISNSTKSFIRKSKVPYVGETNIKIHKADMPSIVSQFFYQPEYITNYSLIFLLTKVDAYLKAEKNFFYNKFWSLSIIVMSLTILFWFICFLVILFFASKVGTNLSNAIKSLVDIIREIAQDSGFGKKTDDKLESVNFPYDDDINDFFSTCKIIIRKGMYSKSKLSRGGFNMHRKTFLKNIYKEMEGIRERETEDGVINENINEELLEASYDDFNKNEYSQEGFDEFDALTKVKRSNLTFNDKFLDFFDQHNNCRAKTNIDCNIERKVFYYNKKKTGSNLRAESESEKENAAVLFYNNSFKYLLSYSKRSFDFSSEKNGTAEEEAITKKRSRITSEEERFNAYRTSSKNIFVRRSLEKIEQSELYLDCKTTDSIETAINFYNEAKFHQFNNCKSSHTSFKEKNGEKIKNDIKSNKLDPKIDDENNEKKEESDDEEEEDLLNEEEIYNNNDHMMYSLLNKIMKRNEDRN